MEVQDCLIVFGPLIALAIGMAIALVVVEVRG